MEEDGQEVAAIISISEYRAMMQEKAQQEDRQQRAQQFRQATRSMTIPQPNKLRVMFDANVLFAGSV